MNTEQLAAVNAALAYIRPVPYTRMQALALAVQVYRAAVSTQGGGPTKPKPPA